MWTGVKKCVKPKRFKFNQFHHMIKLLKAKKCHKIHNHFDLYILIEFGLSSIFFYCHLKFLLIDLIDSVILTQSISMLLLDNNLLHVNKFQLDLLEPKLFVYKNSCHFWCTPTHIFLSIFTNINESILKIHYIFQE